MRFGFWDYLEKYSKVVPGNHFGYPVRPISFIIQGTSALAIYKAPLLVHLFDVFMHFLICVLLYKLIKTVTQNMELATWSAVAFSISPLVIYSVGWQAALMDRMYTGFLLLSLLYFSYLFYGKKNKYYCHLGIFISISLAILSKETAIIAPATLMLITYYVVRTSKTNFSQRDAITGIALSIIPVLIYLIFRAPAILATINGSSNSSSYIISLDSILLNIQTYFAYPFLPFLGEANNIVFIDNIYIIFALLIHIGLIAYLVKLTGIRGSVAYIFAYILPLLPVLILPYQASHYMYASSIILSTGIATALLQIKNHGNIYLKISAISVVLLLVSHSFINQFQIYIAGQCMNNSENSLYAYYLSNGKPTEINIIVENGAPGHIISRLIYGRKQLRESYPIKMKIVDDKSLNNLAHFSKNCIIY